MRLLILQKRGRYRLPIEGDYGIEKSGPTVPIAKASLSGTVRRPINSVSFPSLPVIDAQFLRMGQDPGGAK